MEIPISAQLSSELLAYHAFVKTTLSKGGSIDKDATPAAFADYQRQLNRLRAELRPAAVRFEQSEAGVAIDIEQLLNEVLQDGTHRGDHS